MMAAFIRRCRCAGPRNAIRATSVRMPQPTHLQRTGSPSEGRNRPAERRLVARPTPRKREPRFHRMATVRRDGTSDPQVQNNRAASAPNRKPWKLRYRCRTAEANPIPGAVQRRLPLAAHTDRLPLRIDHPKLLAPSRQPQRRFFLNLQPESDPRLSAFISGQDRFVEVSSAARAQGLGPLMNADFDFHGVRYPFAPRTRPRRVQAK